MRTLYIICGYPFSGKSTLINVLKNYSGENRHVINLDKIMMQKGIDVSQRTTIQQWEEVHQVALKRMGEIMPSGEDIIIDDTNFLLKLRNRWRKKAISHAYTSVVIYVKTPTEEIQRRIKANLKNHNRHDVQTDAATNVIHNFEYPTMDEHPVVFETHQDIDLWLRKNIKK